MNLFKKYVYLLGLPPCFCRVIEMSISYTTSATSKIVIMNHRTAHGVTFRNHLDFNLICNLNPEHINYKTLTQFVCLVLANNKCGLKISLTFYQTGITMSTTSATNKPKNHTYFFLKVASA